MGIVPIGRILVLVRLGKGISLARFDHHGHFQFALTGKGGNVLFRVQISTCPSSLVMSFAVTIPSPEASIRMVRGVASSILRRTSLRFKIISDTSSSHRE
jgi:hypothetical protein